MSILCLIGYATFPWGLSWALSGMEIFPFVTRVKAGSDVMSLDVIVIGKVVL